MKPFPISYVDRRKSKLGRSKKSHVHIKWIHKLIEQSVQFIRTWSYFGNPQNTQLLAHHSVMFTVSIQSSIEIHRTTLSFFVQKIRHWNWELHLNGNRLEETLWKWWKFKWSQHFFFILRWNKQRIDRILKVFHRVIDSLWVYFVSFSLDFFRTCDCFGRFFNLLRFSSNFQ